MVRVGVLTSSRADYGIYKPLLQALSGSSEFELSIIAFGTHLSHFHGYTLQNILDDGFEVRHRINSMLLHDDANSISSAFALTALKFADFWQTHAVDFDVVLCLGDRYEMFGAVSAGIPFNIKFAHIHGGETTLGAIDNIYRHSITLASSLHFTSNEKYSEKVIQLIGGSQNVFTVGSLSLDNLETIDLYDMDQFKEVYNIDLSLPSVLVTFHPETVSPEQNVAHAEVLCEVIRSLENITTIITLPNADTFGNSIRQKLITLKAELGEQVKLIENFGTRGYFSCMKHCGFLLGNSSSGIIEAATFNKYVINIGSRQEGRLCSGNVLQSPIEYDHIMLAIAKVRSLGDYKGGNIYYSGGATKKIIDFLKQI